ncbi:hypothetical protein [Burkholderia ubonensis]|uniref:hypothetical protein n=1 Tax=Burkholderia ubonensis TaxID=101571 RepID=UPI0012FA7C51|nr:hypothetical protein [Burkholderia ubonensis]
MPIARLLDKPRGFDDYLRDTPPYHLNTQNSVCARIPDYSFSAVFPAAREGKQRMLREQPHRRPSENLREDARPGSVRGEATQQQGTAQVSNDSLAPCRRRIPPSRRQQREMIDQGVDPNSARPICVMGKRVSARILLHD